MSKKCLGHILSGSLIEGMVMRLDADCSLEEIKTGKFVSVIGDQYTFFSMIIDLELQVTHPDILLFPPTEKEKLLGQLLKKRDIYARVVLRPMLMLDKNRKLALVCNHL